MQRLARHSTVELTIGRYTHANLNDLGAAVRQMCPLPLSVTVNSDTSNNVPSDRDPNLVALMVAGFCDNHSQSLTTIDESAPRVTEDSLPNADSRNPQSTMTFDEDCGCLIAIDEAERGGFEPPRPLRACRFSRPVHSTALPSLRAGGSLGVPRGSNKELPVFRGPSEFDIVLVNSRCAILSKHRKARCCIAGRHFPVNKSVRHSRRSRKSRR